MFSPYVWRHLALVLFAIASLAPGIYLGLKACRASQPSTQSHPAFRSGVLVYFLASLLGVVIAASMFFSIEISSDARQAWRRNYQWAAIKIGMPRQQVQQLLGPGEPQQNAETYVIHPFYPGVGSIEYDANPDAGRPFNDQSRVVAKDPMETEGWLPYPMIPSFWHDVRSIVLDYSGIGIALTGILSLIPFPLRAGSNSWLLYLPVATLFLGFLFQLTDTPSWLIGSGIWLYPVYAIVGFRWLYRVMTVIE